MRPTKAVLTAIVIGAVLVIIFALAYPQNPGYIGELDFVYCEGEVPCIIAPVTNIVDGDTLDVNNTRIRLALVDTAERGEPNFDQSKQFTAKICPVGSKAIIDVDDEQPKDQFGRTVAKVSCGDKVLNAELMRAGLARILPEFCKKSEFSGEEWAKSGCLAQ